MEWTSVALRGAVSFMAVHRLSMFREGLAKILEGSEGADARSKLEVWCSSLPFESRFTIMAVFDRPNSDARLTRTGVSTY